MCSNSNTCGAFADTFRKSGMLGNAAVQVSGNSLQKTWRAAVSSVLSSQTSVTVASMSFSMLKVSSRYVAVYL